MSDARSETLARMKRIASVLGEAASSAAAAGNQLDDADQWVRGALTEAEGLRGAPLDRAAVHCYNIRVWTAAAINKLPEVIHTYGDSMETAQRASSGIIIETESTNSDLPAKAIAAAATAQMSWANSSGHCVAAQALLQEALGSPFHDVEEKIREAAGMMVAARSESGDAMASVASVVQYVTEYEGTI